MAGDLQTRAAEANNTTKCDFCEERHAFLYCKADSARLCLECDHHVHAANPLALKHVRAPLCECCGDRTATLQCEEETRFFCAACEQGVHDGEVHTLVKVIPFSGRVSPAQLASTWKCHAPTSPFDNLCWTSDGSLSSILASSWTNRLDSFLLSASNTYFADRCGASDLFSGGESAWRKVFLEQLEQLQRLQFEGDDSSAGLQLEPFQDFLALSPEQFEVPDITVEARTYAEVQPRQKVLAQSDFSYITSRPGQTRPSVIKGSWNCTTERKISEARVVTSHETFKQSSEAYRCLPVNNAKELSWIVPPSSLLLSMENTNPRSEEQIFSASQSYININSSRPSAWNPVCAPEKAGVHGRSSLPPKEATESLCFNEDVSVPCVKSSDSEIQLKLNHGRGYSSINNGPVVTDCVSAPTSFETEVSAQARGSAVVRYKEKRKTRNFEKFVRYESRKARAETRLRVRGRFVKANGFNYE